VFLIPLIFVLVSIIFADSSLHVRTFDDVEIHPNPQLNVIVGPNGEATLRLVSFYHRVVGLYVDSAKH